MERKGVYRKGRAGHVRNVNSYTVVRQHYKQWKLPFAALVALIAIFGTAPGAGDLFTASLLTNSSTYQDVATNPELARKALAEDLQTFVADCKRLSVSECVEPGNVILVDLQNPAHAVSDVLPALEAFEARYEHQLAKAACRYDLGDVVAESVELQKQMTKFTDRFSAALGSSELAERVEAMHGAATELRTFVESCSSL